VPALPVKADPLNARILTDWRGRLPVPAYDCSRVTPGVIHVGVGGFHRAHQAMYHDRLMNEGAPLGWAICGVGVMPTDRAMQQALDAQDGLYTLVLRHSNGTYEPRVIESIVEYLFAPDDPEPVTEKTAGGVAVHDHVLRQPAGQRAPEPAGVHRLRPAAGPRVRRLGRAQRALPQLDGRPNHAGDHRRRPRRGRYAEGVDEQGQPIQVVGSHRDTLVRLTRSQREDPDSFIANRELSGDLADDKRFVAAYRSALACLHWVGARATLQALV
jgi:hypothetical protein